MESFKFLHVFTGRNLTGSFSAYPKEQEMTTLAIPRFCNNCGLKFLYVIESKELHQQKGDILYLCDKCSDLDNQGLQYVMQARQFERKGSYERLDQIYEEKSRPYELT